MEPHGYYPVPFTTGLWEHHIRKTKHFLYVDDFGVKYFSKDYADHILGSRKNHYAVLTNWEGLNYFVLTID